MKGIIRLAKERRPGAGGYAEAMILVYNKKTRSRLSLRRLYGGRTEAPEEAEETEQTESAGT